MVSILQLISILIVLFYTSTANAQNKEGEPLMTSFACKTPHFLVMLEEATNQKEVDSAVYIALSTKECFYSSNKFVFYLDYKIHEFNSFVGHSQVWATKEGAYILIDQEKTLDFTL
jgi:hypothetical protein